MVVSLAVLILKIFSVMQNSVLTKLSRREACSCGSLAQNICSFGTLQGIEAQSEDMSTQLGLQFTVHIHKLALTNQVV